MACQWAREESYQEVKGLVFSTARKFAKKYGVYGDGVEDLEEQACVHYCEAYEGYLPEVSSFSNHVRYRIWMGLLQEARKRAKEKARGEKVSLEKLALPAREAFSPEKFFSELSPDAQFLGQLVLDPPGGLEQRGLASTPSLRASLKGFLKDLGWSMERISETFSEIRDALS